MEKSGKIFQRMYITDIRSHRLKNKKSMVIRRCIEMAAKGPRENITLECTECKNRNYVTSKNKRNVKQ